MKIRLATKNSVWKIVQNPLKNNYYTDIMDFENDDARGEFLNKYQFNGENDLPWDDLDAYIDTIVKWRDELHFSFVVDQSEVPFTRTEALRKDFCIIYDDNDKIYRFCTIQASFSRNEWQSTKLEYQGELDVFFTYGIRNIWKEKAEITIERGIPSQQWKRDGLFTVTPTIDINHPAYTSEGFNLGGSYIPKKMDENMDLNGDMGMVLVFKPQRRYIEFKVHTSDNTSIDKETNASGFWEDTILLYSKENDGSSTSSKYLLIENTPKTRDDIIKYTMSRNNTSIYNITPYKYPKSQRVGLNSIYKKNEYYISFYISYSELDNLVYGYAISTLLNSPDLMSVSHQIPGNLLEYDEISSYGITEHSGSQLLLNNAQDVNSPNGFYAYFTGWQGRNTYLFKMVKNNSYKQNFELKFNTPSIVYLTDTQYSPNQYAKLYVYPYYYIGLVNAAKQQWNVSMDYSMSGTMVINRELIYIIQGLYGKISSPTGLYAIGDLRNGFSQEEMLNIESFKNSSSWQEFVDQNRQAINTEAKIMSREKKMAIFNGVVNIASGVANAVSGGALARFGLSGTDFKDPKSGELIGHGITLQDQLNISKGSSEIGGSVEQIARGITSLTRVNDSINRATANLRDKASSSNYISLTGVEFERLNAFDITPYSLRSEEYRLADNIRHMIAQYFHRYGYAISDLSSYKNYINNGRIFDYLQAEFTSVYSGLSENLSPQETKIVAESISYGVRIWHYGPNFTTVGDYSKRNIQI